MAHGQSEGPRQLRAEFLGRREGGPREIPEHGFRSFPAEEEGRKLRERSESFRRPLQPGAAVLYQPDQGGAGPHRRALIFELSKVKETAHPVAWCLTSSQYSRRARCTAVASGLRSEGNLPGAACDAARPTPCKDLRELPPSILKNGHRSALKAAKLGVLVTDDVAAELIGDVRSSVRGCEARWSKLSRRRLAA